MSRGAPTSPSSTASEDAALSAPPFDRILALCRPGFEGDAAAELMDLGSRQGVGGYCRTGDGEGWLEWFCPGTDPLDLLRRLRVTDTVFLRQWLATRQRLEDLPEGDRLTPVLAQVTGHCRDLLVQCPDGEGMRELSRLARSLTAPLASALRADGRLRKADSQAPRLHLVLASGRSAWVGLAPAGSDVGQAGGVQRLRQHRDAPSRSALKLEEALLLLDEETRLRSFTHGVTAVDLGAAPGGWTWVLQRLGVSVTAVDNGALAPVLRGSPLVLHERADAFTWQPPQPVDWLVCDVVDKPARVVELMARWLRRGWAHQAIFNLKLPMKRRWAAVEDAGARFRRGLAQAEARYELRVRQLYHDREEVTCIALRRS